MSRAHLLLVDNDPQNLQLMEVSLRKVGFQVTTSSDGRDALEKATLLAPDLVLSEVALPGLDGFGLLEALRAEPRTLALPVVFLTQDTRVELRVRALEAGVVDYLSKPIYIKEVVARIRIHLQKSERQQQVDMQSPELSGLLADMGLVDLLRTLEGRTGVVKCVGTRGETAALWLRNGRIEDAELGQLAGEAAFFRLLNWPDGRWHFHQSDYERPARITLPPEQLLSDGLRHLDEWSRQLETLPGLDAVYEVDFVVLALRLGEVPDEVNAVLRLLDGRRTLRQVIEGSPFEDAATLAMVNKLVGDRLVRRVGTETTAQIAPKTGGGAAKSSVPSPAAFASPSVVKEPAAAAPPLVARTAEVTPPLVETPVDENVESNAAPVSAEDDAIAGLAVDSARGDGFADPALEVAAAVSWDSALSEDDDASAWAGSADIDDEEPSPLPISAQELDVILAEEGLAGHYDGKRELIEVMRYPTRAGGRRKRLEEEARRALVSAAERGEPVQVLSAEALPPGGRADELLEQRVAAAGSTDVQTEVGEQPTEEMPSFDPSSAVTLPATEAFESSTHTATSTPASATVAASNVVGCFPEPESNFDDEDFSHIVGAGRRGPMIAVGVLVVVVVVAFLAFGMQDSPTTTEPEKPKMAETQVPVKAPVSAEPVEAPAEEPTETADAPPPADEVVPAEPAVFAPPATTPVAKPADPKPALSAKDEVARLVDAVRAAAKRKNWTLVASTARQVLEREPNQPDALRELGKAHYNANHLEEARTSLLQATRVASSDAESFMYLGIVYQELERLDDAKQAYKRFLQLEPKNSSGYKDIAAVLENMER